jgi:MraZ protein
MLSLVHRGWQGFAWQRSGQFPLVREAAHRPAPKRGRTIRAWFAGTYLNGVDAKHRLSIPASIRETIEARSQAKAVVLAPAEHADCLVGYDLTHFERLQDRLTREFEADFGPGRSARARLLFGPSEVLRYDDTGRVAMGPVLRDLGGLKDRALFLGAGDYFELWDPAALLESEGLDPRIARMVRTLVAGKAA